MRIIRFNWCADTSLQAIRIHGKIYMWYYMDYSRGIKPDLWREVNVCTFHNFDLFGILI